MIRHTRLFAFARRRSSLQTTLLVTTALITFCVPSVSHAEPWSVKLGYPSDRRVLILYTGELGSCHEITQAGTKCLEHGHLSSAAISVISSWSAQTAQWRRRHPDLDVGLSIWTMNPWKFPRWRPISPRSEVTSLTDAQGYFFDSVLRFSLEAHPEDVAVEIESQIERAQAMGLRPTHLVSHSGALFARTDLMREYLNAARRHWLPAVVIELTPEHIARFNQMGVPIDDEMARLIANYPLPKVDDFQFVPEGETYEQKRENYFQLLSSLAPGLTLMISRPAIESDALKAFAGDWQNRVWDARIASDPEVHEFLGQQQVIVTNWTEIMRRFENGGQPPNP